MYERSIKTINAFNIHFRSRVLDLQELSFNLHGTKVKTLLNIFISWLRDGLLEHNQIFFSSSGIFKNVLIGLLTSSFINLLII